MGYKGTIGKTNWSLGEISPRTLGRFDAEKPIWRNGAKTIENLLIGQACSLSNRPGTQYIAATKLSTTAKSCLKRFTYSIAQEYMMEIGNLYIRFFSNTAGSPGQVIVSSAPAWLTLTGYVVGNYVTQSGTIYYCLIAHTSGTFATDLAAGKWVAQTALEIPTIFQQADVFNLQTANKADVMYIVNPNYYPQKLIRTSATTFTIANVPFKRGPFLDSNITTTTITPSSATGATTLTASSGIFQAGHVGSLWRVGTDNSVANSGVVLITGFTSATVVTGTVQAEPNGTAGNLGGTGATTFWAEGAFSTVRGYPNSVCFHEGRLVYGGTLFQPQTLFGSVVGAYDDFSSGTTTVSDAYEYEIASTQSNGIRWLASDTALQLGTSGGAITAADGSTAVGISPTTPPNITFDNNYGAMYQQPSMLGGYLFYIQANTFYIRQLTFDFLTNKYKGTNMMVLADHILRDGLGAVQMASQTSPYDRLWVVRNDGQISVFMRDPDQQVEGWSRLIAGVSDGISPGGLAGIFESIDILPIDGSDDQIWVICKRKINGSFVRWVEVFTAELFNNYWEPTRLDASLTFSSTLNITAISVVTGDFVFDDSGNIVFDDAGNPITI